MCFSQRSNVDVRDISGTDLIERQAAYESNARSYPHRIPLAFRSGKGCLLEDVEGRTYIDCLSAAGSLPLGHSHDVVVAAVQRAIEECVPWQALDLTTPGRDYFVQQVLDSLPLSFSRNSKIQFCGPSGADAVEAAVKLVKTATGGRTILAFHGSYHGMTQGALSLSGANAAKAAFTGTWSDVQFLPFPYEYRCPFAATDGEGWRSGVALIESILSDTNSGISGVAGVLLEVVQGEGGVIPARNEWLQEIRRITHDHQVPLVIDEVQTGLGRTGQMFAFEHAGITPDVIVLSKALGGGLPVSIVVYDKHLDRWKPGAHAGTFRGNQLGFAAGAATIKFIRETGLIEHVRTVGQQLRNGLMDVASRSRSIGDVRGRGLMLGVEFVDVKANAGQKLVPPPYSEMALQVQKECLQRGLILEVGGRMNSVVRFLPPLIITSTETDCVLTIFNDAVAAAESILLRGA